MATPPPGSHTARPRDCLQELLGYKRRSVYGVSYRAAMWNSNARNPLTTKDTKVHEERKGSSSLVYVSVLRG